MVWYCSCKPPSEDFYITVSSDTREEDQPPEVFKFQNYRFQDLSKRKYEVALIDMTYSTTSFPENSEHTHGSERRRVFIEMSSVVHSQVLQQHRNYLYSTFLKPNKNSVFKRIANPQYVAAAEDGHFFNWIYIVDRDTMKNATYMTGVTTCTLHFRPRH